MEPGTHARLSQKNTARAVRLRRCALLRADDRVWTSHARTFCLANEQVPLLQAHGLASLLEDGPTETQAWPAVGSSAPLDGRAAVAKKKATTVPRAPRS